MRYFAVKISIGLVGCDKERLVAVPDEAVGDDGYPGFEYIEEAVWNEVEAYPEEISEEEAEARGMPIR